MTCCRVARFLTLDDIPALLALETSQWTVDQAADAWDLHARLCTHPKLCIGGFCADTGTVLASLFLKPATRAEILRARCWKECVTGDDRGPSRSLFGISLTSIDPPAVRAVFAFFYLQALKNGWREIYLGSPIPGFRRAREQNPALDVETYVHARNHGVPCDRQLRYYHKKGFTDIVAVKPGYFPHEASLDYGVLIRGTVPLAWLSPVWRCLPIETLYATRGWVRRLEAAWVQERPAPKSGAAG